MTMPPQTFLAIALSLLEQLKELHQHGHIYQNLSKAALEEHNEQYTLKDASDVPHDLHYGSPEQTGRLQQDVDHRSDFYSLGMVLYEMITGQMPFDAEDDLGWVHAHLAKEPTPPQQLNPQIPQCLSQVLLKLLKKDVQDRYQSITGLQYDLEQCQQILDEPQLEHSFELASKDVPSVLAIPQKLYGREHEFQTLHQHLQRCFEGHADLVFVSGYSGIGKSALVHEFQKQAFAQQALFASGKFDQFKRDIPYDGIIQAFDELTQQLLQEPQSIQAHWKQKIEASLGANAQVVLDVIPAMERLIGPQKPIPELSPTESQNRFEQTFKNLIQTFAHAEHPLVLFLDDLQWADLSTLSFMRLLLLDSQNLHLLILGAFRSNEVDDTHPLLHLVHEVELHHPVSYLELKPLNHLDVDQLLQDTLYVTHTPTTELATLILQKTNGNPFFINQFIKASYDERFLRFDVFLGAWIWDLEAIAALNSTDNVVDLMMHQLKKLPEAAQQLLAWAACVGSQFELQTLATVLEQTEPHIRQLIESLLPIGFVLSDTSHSSRYHFLHDRVQQAAYALLPEHEQTQVHLKIGMLLWKSYSKTQLDEHIFDVINHLNLAQTLIHKESDLLNIAKLNLTAAQKAKKSNAYEEALRMLNTSIELISRFNDAWTSHYDFLFECFKEKCECEYLLGKMEDFETTSNALLDQAQSKLNQVEVYRIQMTAYTNLSLFQKSIDIGIKALEILGIKLSQEPSQRLLTQEALKVRWIRGSRSIPSLIDLPIKENEEHKVAMRLLIGLCSPTYILNRHNLFALVIFKMASVALKYGPSPETAFVYGVYGVLLSGNLNSYQDGYEFGELAVKMNNKLQDPIFKCKVSFGFGVFTSHWKAHIRKNIAYAQMAYETGVQTGDYIYGGYAFMQGTMVRIYMGEKLLSIFRDITPGMKFLEKTQDLSIYRSAHIAKQYILCLEGKTQSLTSLDDEHFSEQELLGFEVEFEQHLLYVSKCKLHCMYGHFEESLKLAELAHKTSGSNLAHPWIVDLYFYQGLAASEVCIQHKHAGQQPASSLKKLLKKSYKQLCVWAKHCPENVEHKRLLLEAQIAKLESKLDVAEELYEQSIQEALKQEFLQNAAIAAECAALFYEEQNLLTPAASYFQQAHQLYLQWGATAKADHLMKHHPQAFANAWNLDTPHSASQSWNLDESTLIKASQVIAKEIDLPTLLQQITRIAMENTGAQKGELVLLDGTLSSRTESKRSLPKMILQQVQQSQQTLILPNPHTDSRFLKDPYLQSHQPKSVLCAPLIHKEQLIGVIYLENNLTAHAFPEDRVAVLNVLLTQAATSIENAKLYETLSQQNDTLRHQNDELQRLDQLKDDFLASTSHELRTPLHGIMGMMDMAIEELQHEPDKHLNLIQNLKLSSSSANRLNRLIHNLLDLSKARYQDLKLNPKTIEIHPMIEVLRKDLDVLLKQKGLELKNDLPPRLCVEADEDRLFQILYNLIGNAIKFTQEGSIRIHMKQLVHADYGERSLPDRVCIAVQDTGIGIPENQMLHIFKKFEQVHSPSTQGIAGTGIGLTITQTLVELHGGTLSVESEEGKGSEFYFDLQKSEALAEFQDPPPAQPTEEPPILPKPKNPPLKTLGSILIVDDEPINRRMAAHHLKQAGYHIVEAQDGHSALAIMEEVRTSKGAGTLKVDLVLLDIMMHHIDGYEVCRQIREHFSPSQVAILLVSAKTHDMDAGKGFEAGADDYLEKPLNKDFLLARVRNSMDRLQTHKLNDVMARSAKWGSNMAFIEKSNSENFCEIHYQDGKYLEEYVTIAELKMQLPDDYIQVNRSTIINRHCVRKVEKTGSPSKPTVHGSLRYGNRVKHFKVSRRCAHEFLKWFE